jgi:hypothetical protein
LALLAWRSTSKRASTGWECLAADRLGLLREQHAAHAAFTQPLQDLVSADPGAGADVVSSRLYGPV